MGGKEREGGSGRHCALFLIKRRMKNRVRERQRRSNDLSDSKVFLPPSFFQFLPSSLSPSRSLETSAIIDIMTITLSQNVAD